VTPFWASVILIGGLSFIVLSASASLVTLIRWIRRVREMPENPLSETHGDQSPVVSPEDSPHSQLNTGSGPQIIAGRDAAGRDIVHNYAQVPAQPHTLTPRLEGRIKGDMAIVEVWNDDTESHQFMLRLHKISNPTRFLQSQLPLILAWEGSQNQWQVIGPGHSASAIVVTGRGRESQRFRVIRVQKLGATRQEESRLYSNVPFAGVLECQLELGADVGIDGDRTSN
jgi:hypothetical protein